MFAETPLDNRTVNKFTAPPPAVHFLSTFSWLSGAAFNIATMMRINISSCLAVL
jgi:hypothetical protein